MEIAQKKTESIRNAWYLEQLKHNLPKEDKKMPSSKQIMSKNLPILLGLAVFSFGCGGSGSSSEGSKNSVTQGAIDGDYTASSKTCTASDLEIIQNAGSSTAFSIHGDAISLVFMGCNMKGKIQSKSASEIIWKETSNDCGEGGASSETFKNSYIVSDKVVRLTNLSAPDKDCFSYVRK